MEESAETPSTPPELLPELIRLTVDYLKKDGITLGKLQTTCLFFQKYEALTKLIETHRMFADTLYFGSHFSMFLDTKKTLWGCGNNTHGQLGLGEDSLSGPEITRLTKIPLTLGEGERVEMVAVGYKHSLLLTSKQRVLVSGSNEYGSLGKSVEKTARFLPLCLKKLDKHDDAVVRIFAGAHRSALLTRTHALYLRQPDTHLLFDKADNPPHPKFQKIPLPFAEHEQVQDVILNSEECYFVVSNTGRLWASKSRVISSLFLVTLPLPSADGIAKFVASKNHFLVLSQQGKLLVKGNNQHGQLGLGHKQAVAAFNEINLDFLASDERIVNVVAEEDISLLLTSHGRLFGAGQDAYLMFGDYQSVDLGSHFKLLTISMLQPNETIHSIASGRSSLGIQTSEGRWLVQGENLCGNLALGDTNQPDDFSIITFDIGAQAPLQTPILTKLPKQRCNIL